MKKIEKPLGFVLGFIILFGAPFLLSSDRLFLKLLIGVGFGYALSRGYTGFAGSVNRAYRTGSTRLMRAMMMMFFITALLSVALLYGIDASTYELSINPINFGLFAGALLFGFGMTFSSCCASGALTDIVTALPRGLITLIFFCLGVFVGFPIQQTASWVKDSWFTSAVGEKLDKGVYLPDLFKFDGFDGYLGALIVTGLLCGIVILLSYYYESYRKKQNTFVGHFGERSQDLEVEESMTPLTKDNWYNRLFVNAWSLRKAAVVLAIVFTILMGTTKDGWGVSTPYGIWFGQALMVFGVDPSAIAQFTLKPESVFVKPFLEHPGSVQNLGILFGTLFFLLTSGNFSKMATSELKITNKQALFFAIGGLVMGFGTRLSNGCNAGALYTPISQFSLSGWVFLVFLVVGGVAGNLVAKKMKI